MARRGIIIEHDWGNGELTRVYGIPTNTYPDELHQTAVEVTDTFRQVHGYLTAMAALTTDADETG